MYINSSKLLGFCLNYVFLIFDCLFSMLLHSHSVEIPTPVQAVPVQTVVPVQFLLLCARPQHLVKLC